MRRMNIDRREILKLGGLAAVSLAAWPRGVPAAEGPRPGAAGPSRTGRKPVQVEALIVVSVSAAAVLLGIEKGYFRAEGLELALREFPSGTMALQTWKAGAGYIMHTGDLPSLTYWFQNPEDYRVIAPYERSAKRYGAVVKAEIAGPQDLKGKTIATRVGSTGSYFVSRYFRRHRIDPKDVTLVNLEPNQMVPALDRWDIDGFFIWEPHLEIALKTSGGKVRKLTTAEGYVNGYAIHGARPKWIQEDPAGVHGYLRALRRAATEVMQEKALAGRLLEKQYGLKAQDAIPQLDLLGYVMAYDKLFFDDFADQFRWAKEEGIIKPASATLDFAKWCYLDGLRAVDPKLVFPLPAPVT